MYFTNWHDLVYMNHHGKFVWCVYLIAIIILLWNIWQPKFLQKKSIRKIKWRMSHSNQKNKEMDKGLAMNHFGNNNYSQEEVN